jgi:hypothetical protein
MSEDEAKQRWCPFVRLVGLHNRGEVFNGPITACIGSACMAWRPERETLTKLGGEEWSRPKDGHGFCGLAGPQQ